MGWKKARRNTMRWEKNTAQRRKVKKKTRCNTMSGNKMRRKEENAAKPGGSGKNAS